MSRFTLPRDIYYGPGALDELKVLAGHKKSHDFHRRQLYAPRRLFAENRGGFESCRTGNRFI